MTELEDLELQLRIAKKLKFEKREIDNLQRLINLKKPMEKKKMNFKSILGWVISIILMAVFSFSAYPEETVIYELIIDFGNDNVFIHEVTKSKFYCQARVEFLRKNEGVSAHCLLRKN